MRSKTLCIPLSVHSGPAKESRACRLQKLVEHEHYTAPLQPGPLSLDEECRGFALIGRECCWRQLSYAIKNQLVASKAPLLDPAPTRVFGCDELVLYGIRELA